MSESTGKKTGKQPVSGKEVERTCQEKLLSCLSPLSWEHSNFSSKNGIGITQNTILWSDNGWELHVAP